MARNIRTARGEIVDFDALIIKQQLAQAPMNVEVARRKEFIDSREGRSRTRPVAPPVAEPTEPVEVEATATPGPTPLDFEPEEEVTEQPVKRK